NTLVLLLSKPDTPRKKHESCSPARINSSPEYSSENHSAPAGLSQRTGRGVLPNPVPSAPPKSRRSVAVSRQRGRRLAVPSLDPLLGRSFGSWRNSSADKPQG